MGMVQFRRDADRLKRLAEKSYSEGKYISALRFLFGVLEEEGADVELLFRIADVYENLGLQTYAIKWLFKVLDFCEEIDIPDVFEALAINYMNLGEEAVSAY